MPSDLGPPILLIRFSYPALSGFRAAGTDLAEVAARLYVPDRLERRFGLFEALTLPSLLAQTDPDFRTVILTGEGLPAAARDRLAAAAARLAGARIVALPHLHGYAAAQRAFDAVPAGARWRLSLRLDDDDALDAGFIARLKRMAAVLAPLQAGAAPLILAHARGYMLDLAAARPGLIPVVERLPLGCGTAMLAPADARENIYRRNHRWLPQFYDIYSEARTPAFIRSLHGLNDSDGQAVGRVLATPPAELAAELSAGFPWLPQAWRRLAAGAPG
jgi:hypothetical protein